MKLFLVLLLCILPIAAKAQDIPSEPKPKFLNKKNLAIITMAAVSTAADGYTTQKFFANPRTYEINPLAGMFGKSRGASAGLAFTGFASDVAFMYLCHRKGWHKMEIVIPSLVIVGESLVSIHNNRLNSNPLSK